MKLSGKATIPAPPEAVFQALTDAAVLAKCIPGCDKMELTGKDEYTAHMKVGIGSIKGSYSGRVKIADKEPPHRFTLEMEGKGAPGFMKGKAKIELKPHKTGTELHYESESQVGGMIAAVGSRLLEVVAKKLSTEFFEKLGKEFTQ
jgi:uncharacterized protein